MKFVASRDQSDEESDAEIIIDNEPFTPADDNKACTQLIGLAISISDDPSDEAWLPPREARHATLRKNSSGRPKKYKKGPDVGSNLTTRNNAAPDLQDMAACNDNSSDVRNDPNGGMAILGLDREVKAAWEDGLEGYEQGGVKVRGWTELREQIKHVLSKKEKTLPLSHVNQLLLIRNFATLHLKGLDRIDASLEIARQWHEGQGAHFARNVRALARYYQVFEQLPIEKCGGRANALSLLKDEQLQLAAQQWLKSQDVTITQFSDFPFTFILRFNHWVTTPSSSFSIEAGQITPHCFQYALNNTILPSLNITLAKPLCKRTARQWLLKLGWQLTRLRKGVYMDGHKRPELCRVEPNLLPGEKEVIANWHDECCFHGNDFKSHAYLLLGQQMLQRKGKGRIIHVSGFINSKDGHLVLHNDNGDIVEEAREIIYPGANGDAWWDTEQLLKQVKQAIGQCRSSKQSANGDAWWDTEQLLKQVKQAIQISETMHPDCALKASEMNKSNGGKQRDTVIPESNSTIEHRGKVQKMTLPNGQPKGLQHILEEHRFNVQKLRAKCSPVCPWENEDCCMARLLSKQDDFINQPSMLETLIKGAGHECIFLPKFHCELNPIEMYWGWCKYRYCEVQKKTFAEAKQSAQDQLDACPTDVICHFINRSWHFMAAYRLGLTERAAEWAVKQKQHRQTVVPIFVILSVKKLATPKPRGKVFLGLFFGVFSPPEFRPGQWVRPFGTGRGGGDWDIGGFGFDPVERGLEGTLATNTKLYNKAQCLVKSLLEGGESGYEDEEYRYKRKSKLILN
ncbi:hypothetical protein SERLA73DRAFT_152883 [Serpula lacrymans var. lacrymans S7.3]|uniref:Uncharacterized protein n=1 Tax=Serpula lacrymans var. lacrymans (strain S7.3) TaxID=936435 RepID=F8PZA8_SERL3|nr:hypothetical protein SERLA73DRAFT_152883 [Serpula lacrymans var. lacrymans S7.3]